MSFVIPAIFLAIFAYYGVTMFLGYRAATGTTWQRLLSAGKDSATKLWAKLVGIVATILGFVSSGADYLNAPQVSAAIQQYAKPQWVAGIMLAVMVITELARNRTLDK